MYYYSNTKKINNIREKKEPENKKKRTTTRGDETDIDADERSEASGRDQIALNGALFPTNHVPTRGAAEQKLSSFGLLSDLLLRFDFGHFSSQSKPLPGKVGQSDGSRRRRRI